MKNVKLISLALSMLISFVTKAQEKAVSKNAKTELKTESFAKIKDTIPAVNVSVNFVRPITSKPRVIVCAPSRDLKKEPLYVLDENIIDAKQFSKINPNNVENIKVLKGNEAISLYGNQALNGVIIIKTKEED